MSFIVLWLSSFIVVLIGSTNIKVVNQANISHWILKSIRFGLTVGWSFRLVEVTVTLDAKSFAIITTRRLSVRDGESMVSVMWLSRQRTSWERAPWTWAASWSTWTAKRWWGHALQRFAVSRDSCMKVLHFVCICACVCAHSCNKPSPTNLTITSMWSTSGGSGGMTSTTATMTLRRRYGGCWLWIEKNVMMDNE